MRRCRRGDPGRAGHAGRVVTGWGGLTLGLALGGSGGFYAGRMHRKWREWRYGVAHLRKQQRELDEGDF